MKRREDGSVGLGAERTGRASDPGPKRALMDGMERPAGGSSGSAVGWVDRSYGQGVRELAGGVDGVFSVDNT